MAKRVNAYKSKYITDKRNDSFRSEKELFESLFLAELSKRKEHLLVIHLLWDTEKAFK